MAERRMFTKKVTDDDNFMQLSASAQALYLHLSMAADDDGFCNQVSISMFKAHASVQDLKALLEARYIYQFENGVIVIKHWRMANALRKDRYTPTAFQEELAKLKVKDNGSYTLGGDCSPTVAEWLPDGCQMVAACLPQDSIGKNSIDKDNLTDTNVSVCRTKDVRQITEAWNSLGLQQLRKVTSDSKRGGMLRARVNEYGTPAVLEAIENVRKSAFLKGQNNRGWVITFDWFVKPNNFVKVLEGNFDDKDIQPPQQPKKKRQYVTGAEYTAPKPTVSDDELWDRINAI